MAMSEMTPADSHLCSLLFLVVFSGVRLNSRTKTPFESVVSLYHNLNASRISLKQWFTVHSEAYEK